MRLFLFIFLILLRNASEILVIYASHMRRTNIFLLKLGDDNKTMQWISIITPTSPIK